MAKKGIAGNQKGDDPRADLHMDQHFLNVFVDELERQATFGIRAAVELNWAIGSEDWDCVWYSIQNLLVAAGNVSKLFWPQKIKSRDRGQALRALMEIPDDSPLAPRTFRNHFEHFDERLEDWIAGSSHNFIDSNIGAVSVKGVEQSAHLRNFDPKSYAVTFRGDTYQLRPVIEALRGLHTKAAARLACPGLWYPRDKGA